ncbi:MAG: hypothetical protein IJU71_13185, partial [Selenomonadaceae bacterium]|nr:hypothetical protein [Selenomonadaceae bacterium]
KYNERPIVYDAGNFLFETLGGENDTGCFSLTIDRDGVKRLRFIPLRNGYGYVVPATRSRDRINKWFADMCKTFGTKVEIRNGTVEMDLNPAPRGDEPPIDRSDDELIIDPSKMEHHRIEPLSEPRPEWIVERVPDEAIIPPVRFGPLKMVGYRVAPECRTMTKRRMLYVETYWTIDRPVESDCRLFMNANPVRECKMPPHGLNNMQHDFCDWMFPVDRWKPNVIYRERFGLRPPQPDQLANVDLKVEIQVSIDGKFSEPFIDTQLIKLKYPHKPYYRTEFPDVIYKSKPGQCWNAEQLAAVTGGKWIVEPPEGWFVQSLSISEGYRTEIPLPTMFVAYTGPQYDFHAELNPGKRTADYHTRVASLVPITAGAIVGRPIANLPADYPLLQVDDPFRAAIELGFAAYKRFKGKMIGVTGSSGKTTTTGMLKHVLGQEHEVTASYGSYNLREMVPLIFTGVRADTAFAIIEMAANAMRGSRGSLTYDMPPHIAVFTSIGDVHLQYYKTLENIARFKS